MLPARSGTPSTPKGGPTLERRLVDLVVDQSASAEGRAQPRSAGLRPGAPGRAPVARARRLRRRWWRPQATGGWARRTSSARHRRASAIRRRSVPTAAAERPALGEQRGVRCHDRAPGRAPEGAARRRRRLEHAGALLHGHGPRGRSAGRLRARCQVVAGRRVAPGRLCRCAGREERSLARWRADQAHRARAQGRPRQSEGADAGRHCRVQSR